MCPGGVCLGGVRGGWVCPGVGGCVWGSHAWPHPISSPLHNNMLGEQCVDQSQQQKGSGRMTLVWGGGSGVVVV